MPPNADTSEIRALLDRPEVRQGDDAASGDGPTSIVGYGSVYGQIETMHDLWFDYDEEFVAGAWTTTIADGHDIRSTHNHDPTWLLGTSGAKTLTLSEDDHGLHYAVDINPDDPHAQAVFARVQRGDVTGSSVWFRVRREEVIAAEARDVDRPLRRILEAELIELGPVVFPAYAGATADTRAQMFSGPAERARAGLRAVLEPTEAIDDVHPAGPARGPDNASNSQRRLLLRRLAVTHRLARR